MIVPCTHCLLLSQIAKLSQDKSEKEKPEKERRGERMRRTILTRKSGFTWIEENEEQTDKSTNFLFKELIKKFLRGEHFVNCEKLRIPLAEVAPDITFFDTPIIDNVEVGKKIGQGGFGIVYKGKIDEKSHILTPTRSDTFLLRDTQRLFPDSDNSDLEIVNKIEDQKIISTDQNEIKKEDQTPNQIEILIESKKLDVALKGFFFLFFFYFYFHF